MDDQDATVGWQETFDGAVRRIEARTALTHETALKLLRTELLAVARATPEDITRAEDKRPWRGVVAHPVVPEAFAVMAAQNQRARPSRWLS